jgi:polyribonucleotide nucleotidyltransferase
MVGALEAAHGIKQIVATIDDLKGECGKRRRRWQGQGITPTSREVEEKVYVPLAEAMRIEDKLENYASVDKVLAELVASIPEDEVQRRTEAKTIFKDLKEKVLRDEILDRGKRLDGRRFDQIRPIWIETGVLPRVHGSAVFTRGETQALVSATLGTEDDAQKIETVEGETYRRFMLHYNFPAVLGR